MFPYSAAPPSGHPPAHVPVWDTLVMVMTKKVGTVAKMFTVRVGYVVAGLAELMDTCDASRNPYLIFPFPLKTLY